MFRLRHERLKPLKMDHGGPSEYQMLRCYDLENTPQPDSPRHLRKNRDDPFDNFINDSDLTDWHIDINIYNNYISKQYFRIIITSIDLMNL